MTKLNLGAGEDRRDGYVSVDLRPEVADCVADVRQLPFGSDSVAELLAMDILEHLPPSHTMLALRHWCDVLQRGGRLTLRIPNLFQLSRWVVEGFNVEAALVNIYGGHKFGPDGEWDCHHAGWTPVLIGNLLGEAGFIVESNDLDLNMTIIARKP